MDIEKLIERLRKHRIIYKTNYDEFSGGACTADCVDAADIISTLQAENEKLRAELEQVKRKRLHELAQADRENRVLPEGSGWFVTCSGEKLTVVMDIEAARRKQE